VLGDLARGAAALALLTLSTGFVPAEPASAATEHQILFRAFTPGSDPDDYPTSRLYSVDDDGALTQVGAKATSNGGYMRFSVPDGTYKLRTSGDTYAGSEPEWYQDHPSAAGAEEIVVDGADVRLDDVFVQRYRTLSGRVVGPDGQPLLGVSVRAYASGDPDTYSASAVTDQTGQFTLRTGLGRWKVLAVDASLRVAPVWAGGAATHGEAQIIDVSDNVTIPTITTNVGGSVSGVVSSTLGTPVRGVWVTAYDARGAEVGSAVTDHAGHYRVRALAAGPKRLRFGTQAGASFPFRPEFYDNVSEIPGLPGATAIPMAKDEEVTGRDAVVTALTQDPPTSPGVTGRVLDSDGTPVTGLLVWAATDDDPGSSGGSSVAVAHTDAAGRYDLSGMPAGTEFRIFFDARPTYDPEGQLGLTPAWFPSSPTYAGAQVFVAPTGRTTLDDAVLADMGGIRGRVLLETGRSPTQPGGLPSDQPQVQAFDLAGAEVESTTVGLDGSYLFDELPAGSYRVRFEAGDHLSYYQEQWWGGESQATGTPIEVESAEYVDGVDGVVRTKARSIVGTVVDESGAPVPDVPVTAHRDTDVGNESTAGTRTDADGTFELLVLPQVYRVRIASPDYTSRYESEFFENSPDREGAVPVTVVDDQPPMSLGTITIAKRPALSGRMSDHRGSPIARGSVTGYYASGGYAFDTRADVNGRWQSPGLPPGSYLLSFSDPNGEHASEFYSDAPSAATATAVSVGPATHVTGLDAQLTYGDTTGPDPGSQPAPSNTEKPRIVGTPTYPEVLTADPGVWSGDPDLEYLWMRHGAVVGRGSTHTIERLDVGTGLTLRVVATVGPRTIHADSAPVTAGRAATHTRLKARQVRSAGAKPRLQITVAVTGPGDPDNGLLRMRLDGQVIRTFRVTGGALTFKVRISRGTHVLLADFRGSSTWLPSRDRDKLVIT